VFASAPAPPHPAASTSPIQRNDVRRVGIASIFMMSAVPQATREGKKNRSQYIPCIAKYTRFSSRIGGQVRTESITHEHCSASQEFLGHSLNVKGIFNFSAEISPKTSRKLVRTPYVCFAGTREVWMKIRNGLAILANLVTIFVVGCIPDNENTLEARCDRREFACINSCHKAGRGRACRICCQESGDACKKDESFSFYSCPDQD
jgi:hypothetical protein